jgi:hypothetical protein
MRLSLIQKDILFLLYHIQHSGRGHPVYGMHLLAMINEGRDVNIEDRNFRVSCHTLESNGLIAMYRNPSLKLFWRLTPIGEEKAKPIHQQRTAEVINA